MDALEKLIQAGRPVPDARGLFPEGRLTLVQRQWMEGHLAFAVYGDRMRLNYYIGKTLGGAEGERYIAHCFRTVQEVVLDSAAGQWKEEAVQRIAQKECIVELPLRLNWGGGWSDTPPYCYENGGTVLNAAILLKGKRPVTVRLTALEEKKIVLSSGDMGVYGEFRLSQHWELSKKIDAGSSNTLIEQIFSAVEDLIEGRMICGAGGGGFLQAVMKKGVGREEVRDRLMDVFQDAGIDVWDCELI